MKTFLIGPVRGAPKGALLSVVTDLESEGWDVHWPERDTDQSDQIGYRICETNVAAIRDADTVHVVWDGKSQGCLFDLGAAFALGKRVIPIDLPPATKGKSFQNMIGVWKDNA